jgi:hypothetical protein
MAAILTFQKAFAVMTITIRGTKAKKNLGAAVSGPQSYRQNHSRTANAADGHAPAAK